MVSARPSPTFIVPGPVATTETVKLAEDALVYLGPFYLYCLEAPYPFIPVITSPRSK